MSHCHPIRPFGYAQGRLNENIFRYINLLSEKREEHFMGNPPASTRNERRGTSIVLYHSFQCQAASWDKSRRVVAKIEWHAGELFPRIGFIVKNLRRKSSNVVKFYNKRGTAEQRIKEDKYALNWTKLSCHDFIDNQARFQLFVLAYNLGDFLRRLALPKSVKKWSLRTLRDKLIKIGAKVVSHARYMIFQMAEVALPQTLFREILDRVRRWRFFDNTCEAGMIFGTAENRVLEWSATFAVCQNSRKRWLFAVNVQLFGRFLRDNSPGRPDNCCNLR